MKINQKPGRAPGLACGLAVLLATAAATPSLAGTVYGSAREDGEAHLFQIGHVGPGRATSHDGPVVIGLGGPVDTFALSAMAGSGDHLIVASVGLSFDYYSRVTPDVAFGGVETRVGTTDVGLGGPTLGPAIRAMTPFGGEVYGVSWNGANNDLYQLKDQPDLTGGYTTMTGAVTYGPGDDLFTAHIATLASFGGQMYGTAFAGGENLFFALTLNGDGLGAHIDDITILTDNFSGQSYYPPLFAMVGTDTGLQGVAWNPAGFNDYFDIAVSPNGFANVVNRSALRDENGAIIHYAINSLGFLPDAALPPGDPTDSVPEPATWALMLAGFGLAGAALRRRTAIIPPL